LKTHIETQNPSAVSAVNFNDVFTGTYENYKIVFDLASSTNANISFRFRNAGSDITTNNYFYHGAMSGSNGTGYGTGLNGNGVSSALISDNTIASPLTGFFDVANPAIAEQKRLNGVRSFGTTLQHIGGHYILGVNLTATYDGFSFFIASGTFTGKVAVYGYRD
jgi:hypothetical protein